MRDVSRMFVNESTQPASEYMDSVYISVKIRGLLLSAEGSIFCDTGPRLSR